MRSTFENFESKLLNLQKKLHLIENRNENSRSREIENPIKSSREHRNAHEKIRNNTQSRIKPQLYDGQTDIDEYLTQFNIISELNDWDYHSKSLYLASSLTGTARSLLNEIEPEKRKDYFSLEKVLKSRFGTLNKAEIYRTQLKSRVREKGESISELAHNIKKLTRQAYPDATGEMIEILALDYFIDALLDSETRLRLRECGPKTLNEAETIAVKMEAHKLADKQRQKNVNTFSEIETVPNENKLDTIVQRLEQLSEKVEKLQSETGKNEYKNWNRKQVPVDRKDNVRRNVGQRNYNGQWYQNFSNSTDRKQILEQRDRNQNQKYKPNYNFRNRWENSNSQTRGQGNMNGSSLGTEARL
ncbi:hypothetical protein ACJMK2_011854 [Sinanodonta woodiana]|uniref:Uncharacterized protein n=1 Tax=Sinanodonta woodiana TaxID=1069815 RepID=A0ABD3V6D1_SINWO